MPATYTKLRGGAWAMRVHGDVIAGDEVEVTKRNGATQTETVSRVLWSDGDVSLCSIARRRQTAEPAEEPAPLPEPEPVATPARAPISPEEFARALGGVWMERAPEPLAASRPTPPAPPARPTSSPRPVPIRRVEDVRRARQRAVASHAWADLDFSSR